MNKLTTLTAIIVDDDSFSCYHLQDIINHKTTDVEVIAICHNAEEAFTKIIELAPDMVFLDVEMPGGMDGFELLKKFPVINFEIIFTTAHDHYAIRAIRISALDYLVKPIETTALQEAISRAKEKKQNSKDATQRFLEIIGKNTGAERLEHLAVPTMEGLQFVGLNDIIYCEGDGKYTKILMKEKKMIMSSRTLGDFEELLSLYHFFRIHKSYLVNLNHLKKYLRGEGGQVIMEENITLDVSRRKKEELLKIVSQF